MTGVFDVDLTMSTRPAGHGYTELRVDRPNPFFKVGTTIRGHEFHYSSPIAESVGVTCLEVVTGTGLNGHRDGLLTQNVMACYTHIHASGVPEWARSFVDSAVQFRLSSDADRKGVDDQGLTRGELRAAIVPVPSGVVAVG